MATALITTAAQVPLTLPDAFLMGLDRIIWGDSNVYQVQDGDTIRFKETH